MKIYLSKDSSIKIQINKVVTLLNAKCKFVQFEELILKNHPGHELINCPVTHREYLKANNLNFSSDEFAVLATEMQYDNNYFYEEEKGLIITSFFGWQYLTDQSKESGLVYLICGMLIDEIIPYNLVDHTQRLGCVNDFLVDKTRVDDGIKKGHLCDACKKYVKDHKLSDRQNKLLKDIEVLLQLLSTSSNSGSIIDDNKATLINNE